jgi:hypothetical protein
MARSRNRRVGKKVLAAQRPHAATADSTGRAINVLIAGGIFFITLAVFSGALKNEFVTWDDDVTLVANMRFRGLGWTQLSWMFSTFYMGHYQPLSWITFGIDYLLWGLNPLGFHLTNLVLHGLNAVLVYYLSLRLFGIALPHVRNQFVGKISACWVALLFSLHPLRVESVAWATQRRDVLSAFFLLWTVFFFEGKRQRNQAGRQPLVLPLDCGFSDLSLRQGGGNDPCPRANGA